MVTTYRTRPSDEGQIERRLLRDQAIHAAVKAHRVRKAVAREHGITLPELNRIVKSIDDTLKALAAASAPPKAAPVRDWPPARIRNCLVNDFGIAPGQVADAGLLSEVLSRSELLKGHLMGEMTVRSVADFLAAHGYALRD